MNVSGRAFNLASTTSLMEASSRKKTRRTLTARLISPGDNLRLDDRGLCGWDITEEPDEGRDGASDAGRDGAVGVLGNVDAAGDVVGPCRGKHAYNE